MSSPLIEIAGEIKDSIKGHRARLICYNSIGFRAEGDIPHKSTRTIGVYPLKDRPSGYRLEEIGYMTGGISAPWLKPVILPASYTELKIIDGSVMGLQIGTWSRIFDEVDMATERNMRENKGKYSSWLETGREPDYMPDLSATVVKTRLENSWKLLSADQIGALETGMVALLNSLREQPNNYVLSLPIRTNGKS